VEADEKLRGKVFPITPRRCDAVRAGSYRWLTLHVGRVQYNIPAHRLVWSYFNGKIPPGMVVNHKDGDRVNNHPSNLEVVTFSENVSHAHRSGKFVNRKRKTPPHIEELVRSLRRQGKIYKEIAEITGLSACWCRQLMTRPGIDRSKEYLPFTFIA
jgi:hypothetical protein